MSRPRSEPSPSGEAALNERREIAAGKKIPLDAGGACGFEVRVLVANQEASCPVDRPVAHQVEQHAGLRLAPVGIPTIGGNLSLRMKGAVAHVIDVGALRRELGPYPGIEV